MLGIIFHSLLGALPRLPRSSIGRLCPQLVGGATAVHVVPVSSFLTWGQQRDVDVHVVDVAVDVVYAEDADVDVDVLFCR